MGNHLYAKGGGFYATSVIAGWCNHGSKRVDGNVSAVRIGSIDAQNNAAFIYSYIRDFLYNRSNVKPGEVIRHHGVGYRDRGIIRLGSVAWRYHIESGRDE